MTGAEFIRRARRYAGRAGLSFRGLDGLDDTPAMSDFTLDYFFAQLLRYLEKNRDELEATPLGACAVTRPAGGPAGPGVVFFLPPVERHHGAQAGTARRQPHSPVRCRAYRLRWLRPLRLRQRPAGAEAFETATDGKTDAILSLCDRFNAETDNGRNMARYDALLNAVIAHIAQANRSIQAAGLGLGGSRDFTLPTAAESPIAADFELVTWLVIMGAGKAGEP